MSVSDVPPVLQRYMLPPVAVRNAVSPAQRDVVPDIPAGGRGNTFTETVAVSEQLLLETITV